MHTFTITDIVAVKMDGGTPINKPAVFEQLDPVEVGASITLALDVVSPVVFDGFSLRINIGDLLPHVDENQKVLFNEKDFKSPDWALSVNRPSADQIFVSVSWQGTGDADTEGAFTVLEFTLDSIQQPDGTIIFTLRVVDQVIN